MMNEDIIRGTEEYTKRGKETKRIERVVEKAQSPDPVSKRPGQEARRRIYQAWLKIEKAKTLIADQRQVEQKAQHLDTYEDLKEAMFHLARAEAYLRHMSRRAFSAAPEDLRGYR